MKWLALAALAFAGCARSVPPRATTTDLLRGQVRWPTLTLAELDAGRQVLQGKCGSCHRPPLPTSQTAVAWPGQLDAMAKRAGLTPSTYRALERYLLTMVDARREGGRR